MNLSFTFVDFLVAAVIAASAFYAAWRGFLKETLTIFAWVAAGFATLYFGALAIPSARGLIAAPWLASIAAYAGVFLVVFIPLSFVGHRFSQSVRNSAIGPLDRLLGIVFGAARGLVIVGLAYLAFSHFVPARRQPEWLATSRTLPLMQETGRVLLAALPSKAARALGVHDSLGDLIRRQDEEAKLAPAQKNQKTYGAADRRALDSLFQKTGGK